MRANLINQKTTTAAVRWLLVASLALIPSAAKAVDWDGTTGLFSDGMNWVGDTVPDGVDANIGNGGEATIVTGDFFTVAFLTAGGFSGVGSITQSGGDVVTNQISIGGTDTLGGSGVGIYTMSGGTLTGNGGQEMWVGSRGGTGTLTMSGDAILTNNQQIHFGRDGATGNGTIGGSAQFTATRVGIGLASNGHTSTVTIKDNATFTTSADQGALVVGWFGDSTNVGILNVQDSATVNVDGEMRIGMSGGHGIANLSGGTVNVTGGNGYFVSGRTGGTGDVTISGNANINVSQFMMAGADGTGSGTITVGGNATVTASIFTVAFEQDTSGIFTINGGSLVSTNTSGPGVQIGAGGAGVNRQLNLNGGTLTTNGFGKRSGNLTVDVNFNGGTIKASADNPDFFRSGNFDGSSLGFTSADLEVQAGGLKFNTNGFATQITQGLNGAGGLIKQGPGTLTLTGANGYAGSTIVAGGTLSITSGFLSDGANVELTTGTIFDLNFVGTDTVNALFVDGVAQVVGTWGSIGSGAAHESILFTGTGMLNVTAVPEPSALALILFGLTAFVAGSRHKAHRK